MRARTARWRIRREPEPEPDADADADDGLSCDFMSSNPHASPPGRSESGTGRLTDEQSLAAAINEGVQLRGHARRRLHDIPGIQRDADRSKMADALA
jgi:hypothetical protein